MPAKASRAAFGEALVELGAQNERIVTVDADLSKSTMTAKFAKTYPARAFNVGIAESGMIGLAAGLALAGRIPFACSFACFVVGRFETIRVSVAYTNAPVKLVGTHVGVAIGEDGYTQMGLEDIACIRSLPNIPIIQPADEIETRQAVAFATEHDGPLYLRLTRQNLEPVHDGAYRFQFGKADVLRAGSDVSILATGGTVWNSLEAAKKLAESGIHAEVVNVATIKPLDEETLLLSAGKTGRVVTVEDHSVHGGLGGAVAELLGEVMPTPVKRLGVSGFGESGDAKGLYVKHGLDPGGIARAYRSSSTADLSPLPHGERVRVRGSTSPSLLERGFRRQQPPLGQPGRDPSRHGADKLRLVRMHVLSPDPQDVLGRPRRLVERVDVRSRDQRVARPLTMRMGRGEMRAA
jgi:Transketolase, C-terminal subunit